MGHRRYFFWQNIADGIAPITTVCPLLLKIKLMNAKLYVYPGKYMVINLMVRIDT